ncbi:MAG: hypothetical protein R3D34_01835 [Nitratireductor sp.]
MGPGITATTRVEDSSNAWRLGLAYEIPEYALRASLIWNSAVDYDMTGTVINPAIPFAGPVAGKITMPQSVEAKFQSGVAPAGLPLARSNGPTGALPTTCRFARQLCHLPARSHLR